ncbi:MAG: murein L,D-transpeptidase catalytic domain family protein [Pseudomonadota bacterium]
MAAFLIIPVSAVAQDARSIDGVDPILLADALKARAASPDAVENARYLSIIDYRKPSGEPRYYLVDLETATSQSLLVSHGKGSDPDHDGYADVFSNTPGSKMSSLGAFVTGGRYVGQHGLSLRLIGLQPSNDQAEARAIVMHGANYVEPGRAILGRSWGCPALSHSDVQRVIPMIEDGSFLYIVGE